MMAGSLTKQPNGLYCRFSSIVDRPTHWNMTKEEYIEMSSDYQVEAEAIDTIENYLQPFESIIERCTLDNISLDEFVDFLIDVGYMEEPTIQKEFKFFLEENSKNIYYLSLLDSSFNAAKEFLMIKFKDKKKSIII